MDTSWIVEGAEVVVYSYGGGHRPAFSKHTMISHVTPKTFLVEGSPLRFNRETATHRGGAWDPNTRVIPLDDPKAARLLREELSRQRHRTARAIVNTWMKNNGDPESTERAIKALQAYRADQAELAATAQED